RSIFGASSRNFKILYIPNGLAHGKSYEHGLVKKCDGHKLCTKSRFDRFFMHRLSRNFKILAIPNVLAHESRNFKILAIPNVLAHRKLYEHSFVIKRDGQTLRKVTCKVEFRLVFGAPSRNFKILSILNVLAHGKSYEHDFMKNATVIYFMQSHTQSRVSIDLLCTISEFQNTSYSQRISPWEVVQAWFSEKMRWS
ncbi:hypothetical protein B296_00009914, partial [Ensete ventricosum]